MRQALIYGPDRQKLIAVVYRGYGKVANQPISPISRAYDANGINPYATISIRPGNCWTRPVGEWARTAFGKRR